MPLTEHFDREEFEQHGPMPQEALASYTALCAQVLEPVREFIEAPLLITSGYDSELNNVRAGRVAHTQHEATADFCAAGFRVLGLSDLQALFDWIRLHSGLPFDQVILEHDRGGGPDIIHVSWAKVPRRIALEGATHNRTGYINWPTA